MAKTCGHCGHEAKDSDRFCIFCGKPFLSDLSNTIDKAKDKKQTMIYGEEKPRKEDPKDKDKDKNKTDTIGSDKPKEEFIPFAGGNLVPPEETEENKKDGKKEDSKKKDKKSVPFSDADEDLMENFELDSETEEQLKNKMELAIINSKKEKLKEKLKEISKDAKSERYDSDLEFAKDVNAKLNAIKEIQKELQDKEAEINKKIGIFKYDEIEHVIEERRAQLTELKRQYKLGKIKENIFEQLKREYAGDYRKAQEQRDFIEKQIRIWISKLKTEKNREEIKLKTVDGRFKAKEIDNERYQQEKADLTKNIEILDIKINVLRNYAGSDRIDKKDED